MIVSADVKSGPAAADGASLAALRDAIGPVRDALLAHPIYLSIDTMPRLRCFMRHHVFAVWDFMCLAKRLQRDLTSLGDVWLPPARPALARFINSVVLGEESDVDPHGQAASHFDLYISAMDEVGAATDTVRAFIARLHDGSPPLRALATVGVPLPVQRFVAHTLDTAAHGSTIEVLASFLFGREDLIPEMFARLLHGWAGSCDAARFRYYVERHIELDGDDHGPAGLRAIADLAGSDPGRWRAATRAAESAIASRIALWNAICDAVADA
jgi:hypothetical protein